jgi:hypothetical protein
VPTPDVDVEHLVNDHGIDRRALTLTKPDNRNARRHVALYFEMKHAADHAQRKVGHEHG